MAEKLLLIGSAAGAVSAIIALGVTLYRVYRKIAQYFSKLSKDIETMRKHDKDQYLSILRLTIVSQEMPISERIEAGEKYITEGGNGAVRHLYERLLKDNPLGGGFDDVEEDK